MAEREEIIQLLNTGHNAGTTLGLILSVVAQYPLVTEKKGSSASIEGNCLPLDLAPQVHSSIFIDQASSYLGRLTRNFQSHHDGCH
jgi:hypothetical protein